MEKKIRQRLMMQQSHREQMAFKEMRKEAEKEEEAAYRETMLAKFAEDDRIEQMNAQKRRMKQLEHRRAVEKLIEERKQQHQADMVTTIDQWWANFFDWRGQHDGNKEALSKKCQITERLW